MAEKISSKSINNKSNFTIIFLILFAIIVGGYVLFALTRPIPTLTTSSTKISAPNFSGNFDWPSYGESAVGAKDYGGLASHGDQVSKPIASIAKTVLTLAVLQEKPLKLGEPGPTLPITDKDIEIYKNIVAQNGSNIPVAVGENLSEYQALQAILIASADNIAETTVIWAFGSIENYLTYANKMVVDLGLKQTHMADASGLSPETVSSAQDLIIIGENLLDNPVLAEIVNQQEADLPVIGKVKNYNTLLGSNGIIGIKTGTTDEAGGCLLFAYKNQVAGKETTMIGSILGAPSRYQVLSDTISFIKNNTDNFKYFDVVKKDQVIGSVQTPWGKKIDIIAKNDFSLLMVPGEKVEIKVDLNKINQLLAKSVEVGNISVEYNLNKIVLPAILKENIPAPSIVWKLFHL